MAMFGSDWIDEEPTDGEREQYRNLTGCEFNGSRVELEKQIENDLDSNHTSRHSLGALWDLKHSMDRNKDDE